MLKGVRQKVLPESYAVQKTGFVEARRDRVACAAATIEEEWDIAWELCLRLHAVRDRLAHLEAKLGVHTPADAATRALRESV